MMGDPFEMSPQEHHYLLSLQGEVAASLETPGLPPEERRLLAYAPELFRLTCRLSRDAEVPPRLKGRLTSAIIYFMDKNDLIPEALQGAAGYVDDVALAATVLREVAVEAGPEVIERHWKGAGTAGPQIEDLLDATTRSQPALLKRLQRVIG